MAKPKPDRAQVVARKPFKPNYSGVHSEEFWCWVKTLPQEQRRAIYSIGCIIQNAEWQIQVISEGGIR